MDRRQHQQRFDSTLRGLLRAAGFVATSAIALAGRGSNVRLNEIDVHKTGIDTREFIELTGTPSASLAGHMLLVVDGDSVNAGVLDRAIDLGTHVFPLSGYFVLGDSALPQKNLDLGPFDQIENGTTTFYLVTTTQQAALTALVGTRISTGPNTTSIGSLAAVVDSVAIADADFPLLDVTYDGAPVVGPTSGFLAAGIRRCSNAPFDWSTIPSDYDLAFPTPDAPTPGALNQACNPGFGFCYGDGSGTNCPCMNNSAVGAKEGCLGPFGIGAKLHATGTASLAADTVQLVGTQMPDGPVMYFQGTVGQSGGAGSVFGDGLMCAGGTLTRLAIKFNVGGTSSYPEAGDLPLSVRGLVFAPGVRMYQGWYRSVAPFCTPATFNLTHGHAFSWVP